jgi:hypothetical protein
MNKFIPRDFNLVVNENVNLRGTLEAVTPGGIEPQRADYSAGGDVGNREPITGFKFRPFKFKVIAYPAGFDTLAMGQQVTLSFTDYLVDEETNEEMGIRHLYRGEIDPPSDSDRKKNDLASWDFEVRNQTLYQKFKNDKLLDQLNLDESRVVYNSQEFWPNRKRMLQL